MRRSASSSRLRPRGGVRRLHVLAARSQAGTLQPPVQVRLFLRWSARATSLCVLGFLALFALGAKVDLAALEPIEWIQMLFFLWTAVGMILAWRWEARGGMLSLLGLLAFHVTEWSTSGRWPRGWALPALAVPGLLFLASAWVGRGVRPQAGG